MEDEKLHNPHDAYSKELLSKPEQARSFLMNYLPESITKLMDFSSLNTLKDTFIDQRLKPFYSDLIFQVILAGQKAYLYFLFDHKSYVDKDFLIKLLGYKHLIWEKEIRENPKWETLPDIISIILYHGKEPWNIPYKFSDIINIKHKELLRYSLDFEYILCDLSRYSDDEIKGEVLLRLSFFVLKHVFDSKEELEGLLPKFGKILEKLKNNKTGLEYLRTLLSYFLKTADVSPEKVHETVEKSLPGIGGNIFMTAAKVLENKKAIEIAKNMLKEGYEEKAIAKVTGLSIDEIQKLRNE